MSSIGIGPKLTKDFGFDIMVYQTSIEFSMEFCIKPDFNKLAKNHLI
jgi:hypothetical protein